MQSYRRRCWECRLNRRTNALSLSRTAPPAQRGSGGAGRRLPPSSFSADEAPSSGAGQTGHGSAGLVDCIDFRDNMILIQAPDSAITLTPGIRALCPVPAAALASQPKVCKLDRIFHWNFMKSEFAGR